MASILIWNQWVSPLRHGGCPRFAWTLTVPSDQRSVGASRVLAISRVTGAVIFDGYVGE